MPYPLEVKASKFDQEAIEEALPLRSDETPYWAMMARLLLREVSSTVAAKDGTIEDVREAIENMKPTDAFMDGLEVKEKASILSTAQICTIWPQASNQAA